MLPKVERWIETYDKGSRDSIHEINVDIIPFEKLKEIVPPKSDDPLLYDGYILDANQIEQLNFFIEQKILPDFSKYYYVLDCASVKES
ncbi:hypothetical protein LZZ85_28120 [Terrimonas sp. NA20]|uniref:DUF7683 domain-containing protein n=1 Tax=Terrimonas ginsenosidimutans TaxID=2908004 RepID=A0ABS9L0U3_9BACT|nr:hypothetical protein [Terrimonas ginsenosidimutans]MCG2618199.1 hypothetical protein [Terrimonas ginsenosidimutans]